MVVVGGGSEHPISVPRGGCTLPSIYADARAIMMTSPHSAGAAAVGKSAKSKAKGRFVHQV